MMNIGMFSIISVRVYISNHSMSMLCTDVVLLSKSALEKRCAYCRRCHGEVVDASGFRLYLVNSLIVLL